MEKLLFGISGLPIGDGSQKFEYKTSISYLKSLGLDAMELAFVRSVNVSEKNKPGILKAKSENDFYLSAHGSYYVNLNADEPYTQELSMERIIKGATALKKVGGRSLIFHAGYYLNDSRSEAYKTILDNLKRLPYFGVDYRLETTGKRTQSGSIEELVDICSEIDYCKLCIDFSHVHARGNGSLKNYEDFCRILLLVEEKLGISALEDMHIHMAGINYGEKGEKNHLPFEESDFNYKACLRALKDFNVKGCVVCESPLLEKDALLLKDYYSKL
jgi:deoxyribonuclease IV